MMSKYLWHHKTYALICLLSAMAFPIAVGSSPAQASTWQPFGAAAEVQSSNFLIEIGGLSIECRTFAGEGSLGKGSSTWSFEPVLANCIELAKENTAQVKVSGAWTVTGVNSKEATLTIPKGKESVEIEVSPKCTVSIAEGGTLGSAEDFQVGGSEEEDISAIAFSAQKVSVTGTSKECGESATTAKITSNINMFNLTTESEALAIGEEATGHAFWHHRAKGEKGEGTKIDEAKPEGITGKGGEQVLAGKVGGSEIQLAAKSVQIKGMIFDNTVQGQIKEELVYNEPHLVKPELKGCTVVVGEKNIAVIKGHLAWKWNGEEKQLEESAASAHQTPELVFSGIEPATQESSTEKINLTGSGALLPVKFSSGCSVLAGTFDVVGSEVGILSLGIESFGKTLSTSTVASEKGSNEKPDQFLLHFLSITRKGYVGLLAGLTFGSEPASLTGQTELEPEKQEIAIFEK